MKCMGAFMSIVMRVEASEVGTRVTEVTTLNSSLATDCCYVLCFSLSSIKYKNPPKMVFPPCEAHHFAGRDAKRLTPPSPCYILRGSKSFGSDLKSGESPTPEVLRNPYAVQVVRNLSLNPR